MLHRRRKPLVAAIMTSCRTETSTVCVAFVSTDILLGVITLKEVSSLLYDRNVSSKVRGLNEEPVPNVLLHGANGRGTWSVVEQRASPLDAFQVHLAVEQPGGQRDSGEERTRNIVMSLERNKEIKKSSQLMRQRLGRG